MRKMEKKFKILITGGSGYLGRHISDFLADYGHAVRVLSNDLNDKLITDKNIEYIKGDILSELDIDAACKDMDVIIHLAALDINACRKNPKDCMMINALGTRNMINMAFKHNVKKFLYLSTIQVYGVLDGVITEDTPVGPKNDYAISKLVGELYCKNFLGNTNYTIIRLSNGYGYSKSDNGKSLVVNDLVRQCFYYQEMTIRSKGSIRNFVSINDIVQAINIIIEKDESNNKIYNVGGKDTLSVYQLAEKIANIYYEVYGKNSSIKLEPNKANLSNRSDSVNVSELVDTDFSFVFDKISRLGYEPKHTMDQEIRNMFMNLERDKHAEEQKS